jgi:hypothetical protein
MSQATAERVEVVLKPRFQASLWGLAGLVLTAAVYFTLVRGAHGFWLPRGVASKLPVLDIDRVLALPQMALGTLIAVLIFSETIHLLRTRRQAERQPGAIFSVAWRGLAVLILVSILLRLSAVVTNETDPGSFSVTLGTTQDWKAKLGSLTLGIALIGLLLGATPPRERRYHRPARRMRWVAPQVVFAGLAGLLILTFYGLLFPYMVLLALEAVSNAMMRPALSFDRLLEGHQVAPIFVDGRLWQPLAERLMTVGLEAGLGLILCLLTACWLGRDLRATPSERETPRTWLGVLYRGLTAIATWGMGGYLLFKTLPRLHPALAEGFSTLLHPGWTLSIAASFGALAAGLAARGIVEPEGAVDAIETVVNPRRRRLLRLVELAAIAVLVMVIVAAVFPSWFAPIRLTDWLEKLADAVTISTSGAIYFDPSLTPEALVVLAGTAWISVLCVRFLLTKRHPNEAPLDRIGRDRRLLGRFLGAWFALTGVMLTLFPAFFLAGLAVFHLALKAVYP